MGIFQKMIKSRLVNNNKKVTKNNTTTTAINNTITKTRLFKYTENFTTKKYRFLDKKSDIFLISAQNIDCGYSLEPPRRGGSNEYHNLCFQLK